VILPNAVGGANWPGGAVDPETGMLYVQSVTNPCSVGLASDPARSNMRYVSRRSPTPTGPAPTEDGREQDVAELIEVGSCSERRTKILPVVKPPWGRITAIDLNTGEHVWMVPNGDTPEVIREHPLLKGLTIPRTGRPDRGGMLVTKTLLFAGEGAGMYGAPPGGGGRMFRAFDKQTGAIIAELELPANQSGLPMTYLAGGRQFIVVAVSGRGMPGELVALAVPAAR
jgi:quinoprotein glucose dehydrogenase